MSGATIRGIRCPIYTRTKVQRFAASGRGLKIDSLAAYLRGLDAVTSVRPAYDAAEFQINEQGCTLMDGYRFTLPAFRQAAQIMGPGISKFLPDLSGMTHGKDDNRQHFIDGRLAMRMWNELVDLRFPLFERYRIIRNDQERTIEGFVSHKHQYLENIWLYQEAVEVLSGQDQNVAAYAASLVGRRFSLWFRQRTPTFTIDIDGVSWPFYGGCYFTNGEATGTSVRGTVAVFTRKGCCLGAYRKFGKRVTHVGRDFMQRVGEMFSSVLHAEIPWDKLQAGVEKMASQPLGFVINSTKEQRKERAKKLTHSLSVLGVQKNLAVEAVDLALSIGRNHGLAAVDWAQANQLYAGRNVIDLFVPLLGLARRVDSARREKLEQAAFDVMMGRLLL